MKKLYGVTAAMVTPFDRDDRVDVQAIGQLVEFLLERGVHCLYPTGTTGEMLLMSAEERELVASGVVEAARGRAVVYIHTGAATLSQTMRLTRHAHRIGADGAGIVTPMYHVLDRRAMMGYYREVSACVPREFPLYIYVIPQLAGNDVPPEVMEAIADQCPNIIGVKYSGADMQRVSRYRAIRGGEFSVVFGKDDLFLPALSIGCDGTVSGCACAVPEPFVAVYNAFLAGDLAAAARAQRVAGEVVSLLKAGADMSYFKNVLKLRGVAAGSVRKPLLDLEERERQRLLAAVRPYLQGPFPR